VLVLVNHWRNSAAGHCRGSACPRCKRLLEPSGFGEADRRNADLVTLFQASVCINPSTIDPDLAAADQPVDMRLRHPAADSDQKIIESLPMMILINNQRRRPKRFSRRRRI